MKYLIEERLTLYNFLIDKILKSKKFKKLYESLTKDKNIKNYTLMVDYLDNQSVKYKIELFLSNSENNLIYNTNSENTFEKYLHNEIKASNKYIKQAYTNSNLNGESIVYFRTNSNKIADVYFYTAKKFNSSLGVGNSNVGCICISCGTPIAPNPCCTCY